MRKFLFALLPLLAGAQIPTIRFSPDLEDTLDSRVAWLKQHTSDLTDLQPLKQSIGNASVVILYSSSGKLPADTQFRIAKFLHEEMAFDIFATHASAFEADDFDRALDAGKPAPGPLPADGRQTFPRGPKRAAVPKEVVAYLESTHRTPHPLHTAGLRTFLDPAQSSKLCSRMFALIDRVDPSIASPAERTTIAAIVRTPLGRLVLPPSQRGRAEEIERNRQEALRISGTLLKVKASLERVAQSSSPESREALLYTRLLGDLATTAGTSDLAPYPPRLRPPALPGWVATALRANSKLIVWDGDPAIDLGLSGLPFLRDFGSLPEGSAYVLAITEIRPPGKSRLASKEEFDAMLYQTGKPSQFLDFRHVEQSHWLHQRLNNRWTDPETLASPAGLFDGLVAIVR